MQPLSEKKEEKWLINQLRMEIIAILEIKESKNKERKEISVPLY